MLESWGGWVGGWVGGGWVEENETVGMRCWTLMGWVGRGEEGGSNELLSDWGG